MKNVEIMRLENLALYSISDPLYSISDPLYSISDPLYSISDPLSELALCSNVTLLMVSQPFCLKVLSSFLVDILYEELSRC